MKKIICILTATIMIFSTLSAVGFTAFAEENDKYEYYVNEENNTVTIAVYNGNESSVEIPSTIDSKEVCAIESNAFSYNDDLVSVTIPDTVKRIGSCAFLSCQNLKDIVLPSNLEYIGDSAFQDTKWFNDQPDGCIYIGSILYGYKGEMPENTEIVVKDGTTMISGYAFNDQPNLAGIKFNDDLEVIDYYAFGSCKNLTEIEIPDSVTEIGYYAFYNCENLEKIKLSKNVKALDAGIFDYCSKVKELEIPDGITSIGYFTFSSMTGLESVVIPDSVERIEGSAFSACTSLKNVTLGKGLKEIDGYAFVACLSLENIEIPDSVERIAQDAFANTAWEDNLPDGAAYLGNWLIKYVGEIPEDFEIPDGTVGIADNAFGIKGGLLSITVPKSVKYINYSSIGFLVEDYEDHSEWIAIPNFLIRCYKDSAAEEYAINFGFDYEYLDAFVDGDINCDGILDIVDVAIARAYIVGGRSLDDLEITIGDMNDDEALDIIDVVMMRKAIVG